MAAARIYHRRCRCFAPRCLRKFRKCLLPAGATNGAPIGVFDPSTSFQQHDAARDMDGGTCTASSAAITSAACCPPQHSRRAGHLPAVLFAPTTSSIAGVASRAILRESGPRRDQASILSKESKQATPRYPSNPDSVIASDPAGCSTRRTVPVPRPPFPVYEPSRPHPQAQQFDPSCPNSTRNERQRRATTATRGGM